MRSDYFLFYGKAYQLHGAVNVELEVKPLTIPHNGGWTQIQVTGYARGGMTGGNPSQDVCFPFRKWFNWRRFDAIHVFGGFATQRTEFERRKTPHVYVVFTSLGRKNAPGPLSLGPFLGHQYAQSVSV